MGSRLTALTGSLLITAATLAAVPSFAVDIDGNGDKSGIQALYLFKNFSNGVVPDSSGVGTPLNLTVDKPENVSLATDPQGKVGLALNAASALKSASGNKINQACGATNEITIEAWVRNFTENPIGRPQPLKIVTLARRTSTTYNVGTHENNFYLGQKYDSAGLYEVRVNAGAPVAALPYPARQIYETEDAKGFLMFGDRMPAQRVVFTKDANGVARLWRTNAAGLLEMVVERSGAGNISQWVTDPSMILSVGSEPGYLDFPATNNGVPTTEWKYWLGTVYVVAIYCRAMTPTDLQGDRAPGETKLPTYPVNVAEVITPARTKAQLIYKRITGINSPIDNPVIKAMEPLVGTGNLVDAALLATQENAFYNITVRDFAARMSTREGSVNVPLNDMSATIIGAVRDNLDGRQLLTGNFSYRGDQTLVVAGDDEKTDFLMSNRHYESLEKGRYDLARVLRKVDGQKLYNGATDSIVLHPDTAGVITSRAFMEAHADAGTNRRLVERTMQEFLCIPIQQWADTQATDTYVGRDVDRAPGNEHAKYKTTCRTCHSVMDSFRGAFAKVDFSSNYVKHTGVMGSAFAPNEAANTNPGLMYQDPPEIAGKMNRNKDEFPAGNPVETAEWVNNAGRGLNAEYFGWPAVPSGQATHKGDGMRSFATLVSQSHAFPRCMAMRAFRAACKREPTAEEKPDLYAIADTFKSKAVNIREIFARVSVSQHCIGQ